MNPEREIPEDFTKNFIITNSGRRFYPFGPQQSDLNINDIAHSLSMKCRWNGHVDHFYSVAQHSIDVMEEALHNMASPLAQLQALMHDAGEAYTVDMPTPLKVAFPAFIEVENNISKEIAARYGYPFKMFGLVKDADYVCLLREAMCLFESTPDWVKELEGTKGYVKAARKELNVRMDSGFAKQEFIKHFERLRDEVIQGKYMESYNTDAFTDSAC